MATSTAAWRGPPLVIFEADDTGTQSRLTILLRLLLALPQFVVSYLLGIVASFVIVIGWFAALVLGRLPRWVDELLVAYLSYFTRVNAYTMLLTDRYPPFAFQAVRYPVRVVFTRGHLNRLAVFFRLILVIPAAFVAALAMTGWWVAGVVIWIVALVVGRLPHSLFRATAAVLRYNVRTNAYFLLLSAAYPSGLYGDRGDRYAQGAPPPDTAPGAAPPGEVPAFLPIGYGSGEATPAPAGYSGVSPTGDVEPGHLPDVPDFAAAIPAPAPLDFPATPPGPAWAAPPPTEPPATAPPPTEPPIPPPAPPGPLWAAPPAQPPAPFGEPPRTGTATLVLTTSAKVLVTLFLVLGLAEPAIDVGIIASAATLQSTVALSEIESAHSTVLAQSNAFRSRLNACATKPGESACIQVQYRFYAAALRSFATSVQSTGAQSNAANVVAEIVSSARGAASGLDEAANGLATGSTALVRAGRARATTGTSLLNLYYPEVVAVLQASG